MRLSRNKAVVAAMFIAVCFVGSAAAQKAATYTHSDAGLQFTVPDKWKVDANGDLVTVASPDDTIGMFFLVLDISDLEKAADAVDSELDRVITDVKIEGEGSETKVNGLDAYLADGSGKLEGTPVQFGVMLVASKKNKVMMIVAVGKSSALKQHDADVTALLGSIKPVD